ncbi:MAG: 2'-deoxycytidine 5'-triphosphate deaminase [Brevundimonas sp.]|uniref:2'-deoxycytidine 5'-triphosphate deaminase n=1 Tax=Brevundimonas albigilva TaxID=1312364 RepID=A0ABY4SKG8_9CAUL|nr:MULTISPECIES: 2'-deoxycytidine 5'-triphosphate deaminase [Brevundimonas]MCV0414230.1 2'-deoxycytidine 5'-triphosphate deaminase [Brevundimonas sp.]PZU58143.1 MAG: 2'-deoxycytidine 5'-triphosphate deaminase [Brevundimonas sp.]UQV17384.1 2'-deoxycytidine 5'-triphosphate deaminase [Brevundimonas albigilva]URI14759.1 2'-deoxycytidine 5'-triphosphate deaminase [Brevundimonas albigilva]
MTFQTPRPGILPAQSIETLIATGAITSDTPFDPDQVQPASLDLRLSDRAWRVRASFLPGQRKVEERIADVAMHAIDITGAGVVLEKGCVYIARLQERLSLPQGLIARANPKSSTGRVDVFVRLLTDRGASFDDVDEGYDGPLYLEIAPQTFSILVRPGTRLNQLRLKAGEPPKLETRSVGVDLQGGEIVGFRGRRHAGVVDLDHIDGHDPRDFWEPLSLRRGELLLDPGEFYILASSDDVEIPVDQAAEMTPIDPSVGEFRVHYAGFFDPGFGTDEAHGAGSKGVLEVRTHDTPFLLEHGQIVARLVYEPLTERPSRLYGESGSHYQSQGLKLSKHFRPW